MNPVKLLCRLDVSQPQLNGCKVVNDGGELKPDMEVIDAVSEVIDGENVHIRKSRKGQWTGQQKNWLCNLHP